MLNTVFKYQKRIRQHSMTTLLVLWFGCIAVPYDDKCVSDQTNLVLPDHTDSWKKKENQSSDNVRRKSKQTETRCCCSFRWRHVHIFCAPPLLHNGTTTVATEQHWTCAAIKLIVLKTVLNSSHAACHCGMCKIAIKLCPPAATPGGTRAGERGAWRRLGEGWGLLAFISRFFVWFFCFWCRYN